MYNTKFIQTLYIGNSIDPYRYSFGWASPEYHLMGWTLSCLQLQKIYNKIELYANGEAAKLLIDILVLPYHKVNITHDKLSFPHEKLWALPKILTYSLQDSPFLHIDGDVFLFSKFQDSLLRGELIAQNIEVATDYYTSTQKELMENFTYFPECVKRDFDNPAPIKAVNAGILGGNNIDFIKEYASVAFEYINRNAEHLTLVNTDRFNVFFEQHLFYSLAREKEIPIDVLINATIMDNQYLHLGDFHEVPCKRDYLHLLGQYKKDEYTCRLMAAKLRQLYPEYYFRIISLFKTKGIPVSTSLFTNDKLIDANDNIKFTIQAKKCFLNNAGISSKKNLAIINATVKQINTLVLLKNIIDKTENYKEFSKAELEEDYAIFSENLLQVVKYNYRFEQEYIYGRDLESVNWFCDLFGNDEDVQNKSIQKCNETSIIKSGFDWAGLFNQHTRTAVKYYETLELNPGEFYNLVVPELYGDGFSLQDIDEIEKIILGHLTVPLSIVKLYELMSDYVEEDVIVNHIEKYQALIIAMLKQLVLKKAIKPA